MSSSTAAVARDKNKRRNAPLSCAECRRLKLRCSRVFPCASCVKKGCAAICPDGSLTTGKGNRFVLANTEELHDKISILSNRVRDLEDALQDAHSHYSRELHPLLSEELLQLKRPLERESQEVPREPDVDTAETIDAVGSLHITDSGHAKFFGTTANAWYLLQNEEGEQDETESPHISLPADIPWLSHTFPFLPFMAANMADARTSLVACLPEAVKAKRLAEIYFRHAAWMYTPIPETEFYNTIMNPVYEQNIASDQDSMDSHMLAVLYMVLALGTLLDLDKPALSPEATQYYQLARASLSLDSILESQSVPAIQTLLLMCHFMFLSFIEGPRWALMGIAVKLAQSVGLHRDSGKWKLSAEETYKRRSLLWELYTYDSWQSLTFGRPPSFATAFIDCQMAEDTTKTAAGETEMTFAAWKHRFSSRCLSIVHEQAFGARNPSYKTIQELDKKVRNFYVPPSLRVPGFGGSSMEMELVAPPVELTMQRYIAFAIREITIFYMHRGFFARAMEDNQEDPLGSKYAPSVLAAYNSACSFVGLVRSLHSQHPLLTERMWFLFTHVFSCAIVLGSIPTKSPGMVLAPSALSHLDTACKLFEAVSENARAAKVLPVLRKLKGRAARSMSENRSDMSTPASRLSPDRSNVKEEDEELAALGGKTRLVSRKSPSLPSSPQGTARYPPSPSNLVGQLYPSESPPLIADALAHNSAGAIPSAHWPTYQQQPDAMYDYSYHVPAGHWHPEQDYHHAQAGAMAIDMGSIPFPPYTHVQGVPSFNMPSQSPMENHVHHADPNASWQNLFAQFDQP